MSLLALQDLTVRRDGRDVVQTVTLTIGTGEFVGLIGPNGAGKTTLMRAALGLIPARGHSNLAALDHHARAREAAWLPQQREIAWAVDVETLVRLGRIPHHSRPARNDAAVDSALDRMGIRALRNRPVTGLSGGEQARVLIARALAQDTPLLLADEPIAGLDPAHQLGAMAHFARLAAEGRGVLASLHDLGLAARFCTRLILMERGRIVADGLPEAVLSPGNLAGFGLTGEFVQTSQGPVFVPLGVIQPEARPGQGQSFP